MNLKNVSTEDLLEELNSRKSKEKEKSRLEVEADRLKNLNIKGFTTAQMHVEYIIEDSDWPHFMFYFDIDGKPEDLYYGDVDLEFENKVEFVPSCFAEASENNYEYSGPGAHDYAYKYFSIREEPKLTLEEKEKAIRTMIDGARDFLISCGFRDLVKFNYK